MKTVEQQLDELGATLRSQEPSQESYERGLVLLKNRVARERHASLEHALETPSVWARVTATVRVVTSVGDSLVVMRSSAMALAFVVLLGGAGIYAGLEARTASPSNESLYTLKSALQKTQVVLSFSDSSKAKTQVVILEQRVAEVGRELERTAEDLDSDISGIAKALENAQIQAAVVKEHLTQLSDDEDTTKLAEQVAEVQGHIETYSIAASETVEDTAENIKEQIDPEILELANALSEISALVEQPDEEGEVKGAADESVEEGKEALEEGAEIVEEEMVEGEESASETVLTEEPVSEENTELEQNEENPVESAVIPAPKQETPKITPEMDTFKVFIGN